MAVLTNIGRHDMGGIFAGCGQTVVAARTVVDDIAVIKNRWQPCNGRVTVVTLLIRRNVRRRFAGGLDAIVATGATAGDGRVIHTRDR